MNVALLLFDVFGPSLVDEGRCSVTCFAVSCHCEGVYLFFLFSPGLADRTKVPLTAFELVQLLNELLDPVIVCQPNVCSCEPSRS